MKNKKIKKYLGKKAVMSYSQIYLLLISLIAFMFIINMASGEEDFFMQPGDPPTLNDPTLTSTGSLVDEITSPPVKLTPTYLTTLTPVGKTANYVSYYGSTATAQSYNLALTGTNPNALLNTLKSAGITNPSIPSAAVTAQITPAYTNGKISRYTVNYLTEEGALVGSPVNIGKEGLSAFQSGLFISHKGGSSWLSQHVVKGGLLTGGWADALVSGAQWAALAFGAGYAIGSLIGMDKDNTMALSAAMATGFGVAKFLSTYQNLPTGFGWMGKTGFLGGLTPWAIGAGVGFAIFAMMYEKEKQEIVKFECLPWQAPKGGEDCEKCNNGITPCTEYRCKSLGQLCELENKGSGEELCLAVDIRETDPPIIKPNSNELTEGYKYVYPDQQVSPPSHGFRIIPSTGANQCIKPFTPIKFGINTFYADGTPAPSRCKIDINHTTSFDDMAYWMGGSSLYAYNHTDYFSLPNVKDLENSSLKIENGKTMVVYIRCEGKNDKPNVNPAEYMLRFCIDPSPDTTPPKIMATSLSSNSCVSENTNSALVDFYTNEPAECKWSYEPRDFKVMEGTMTCANEVRQMNEYMLYTCRANLTGIKKTGTDFYVRCLDKPELKGIDETKRYPMANAEKFTYRSSEGLRINKILPKETIYSGASPVSTEIQVETSSGCNDGRAKCYYSFSGQDRDYLDFIETDTNDGVHKQTLSFTSGRTDLHIKCVDEGGNVASNVTTINIDVVSGGPVIARAYVSTGTNKLVISTLRDSECVYSFDDCEFSFKEGIEMPNSPDKTHYADLRMDKNYYIKCKDEYSSEPVGCSIILKPQLLV